MPASRRLKLMDRKMGWALTSEAPLPWQPSLTLGSLARSWRMWEQSKCSGAHRCSFLYFWIRVSESPGGFIQIVHPPSCRGTWHPRRTCWSIPPPPPSPASPLPPSWSSFSFAERATGPRSSRTAGSPAPTSLGWTCSARFSPPLVLEEMRKRRIWSRKSPSQICGSVKFTHPCTRPSPPVLWWSVPLVHEQLNPGLISWCGLKTQKNQQVTTAGLCNT